ncbi:MAG TPA: hypothetical protein VFM36_03555 [Thermoanaerobaculia bacterium]|nr:hypothetical protein [Thermoanaerobaculia bacterium]
MNAKVRILIVLTAIAAAARLFAMTFLHPLNWDEVEYFRATNWVREGLVPFRDFWEHHTPLQWFVFAPVTALTSSPGASAIILMRWAQVPLWIAAFWLALRLMDGAGIDRFGRWVSIVLAVSSSLLMISAMEYRVDVLANVLYLGGLALLLRGGRFESFAAGALFCLAGLANLRLGPLLAVTALLGIAIDTRELRWRFRKEALLLVAGVAAILAAALVYFVTTDSLRPLYQHVWVENYIGEKHAERVPLAFVHRILVPFGVRIYGGDGLFDVAGFDLSGAAILLSGVVGLVFALRRWRRPDALFFLALLQIANIAFVAGMKFVYHYHLQIVVLLVLPFVASVLRPSRSLVAFVVLAVLVHVPIVVLRGKERELRYQDQIMREADARTAPGSKVFDGVGWALRRKPAYHFWFLPVLARQLVANGHAAPYTLAAWMSDPPAAVITDRNAVVWLASDPQLGGYVARHYLPLLRNLWIPGMSARLETGGRVEWVVPATARYRLVASSQFAEHSWFATPFGLHAPVHIAGDAGGVSVMVNGVAVDGTRPIELRHGQRVLASSSSPVPLGVFLVPGDETSWFRQPPRDVTIDAEGPRTWHWPSLE